jgi:hypothetical protein
MPIREHLEPLLTNDDVERGVGERETRRLAASPLDAGSGGLRHLQSGLRPIEADHDSVREHSAGRPARDDAGPAGHIQDALAGAKVGRVEEMARPGIEELGNPLSLEERWGGRLSAS